MATIKSENPLSIFCCRLSPQKSQLQSSFIPSRNIYKPTSAPQIALHIPVKVSSKFTFVVRHRGYIRRPEEIILRTPIIKG
jgi:hypothetical protein